MGHYQFVCFFLIDKDSQLDFQSLSNASGIKYQLFDLKFLFIDGLK